MHELFTQVLSKKDLSKAGDLFSVADAEIVNDLTEVVTTIAEIASLPDYVNNDNDQSVVEICITRVTSAIRETNSIEQHSEALVSLLESCLNHNLKPSARDEDPPHAKISSDIISCIFLNYNKKEVMRRALPVAVKFLHKGNKELSRNMSSYLSLAAIENADLLSKHIQLIIDSIISGNFSLCRVLPQIYEVTKEPVHEHAMALVSLLPLCENQEKLALLLLFAMIAKNKPALLEPSLPQLCEYLSQAATASDTMKVFVNMAEKRPQLLVDHLPQIKKVVECHPNTLCLAAQVISSVGKLSKDRAQEALNFVLEHLPKADRGSQHTLLHEATRLCSSYPVLFTDKMLQGVRQCGQKHTTPHVNLTSGGVTIVKVGGSTEESNGGKRSSGNSRQSHSEVNGALNRQEANRLVISRPRLGGDSRSTGRLHVSGAHRSMTRLNISGGGAGSGGGGGTGTGTSGGGGVNGNGSRIGSVGGLHKSMTRLSSSQQINLVPNSALPSPSATGALAHTSLSSNNRSVTAINNSNQRNSQYGISSGGVTVTTTQDSATSARSSIGGSGSVLRDDRELVSISTSFPLNGPPVTYHTTRDSTGNVGRLQHTHVHSTSQQSQLQSSTSSQSMLSSHTMKHSSNQIANHNALVNSQQQQLLQHGQQNQHLQSQHLQQQLQQQQPPYTQPQQPPLLQQTQQQQQPPSMPALSTPSLPAASNSSVLQTQPSSSALNSNQTPHYSSVVTPRRQNTSVTIISSNSSGINPSMAAASQRISVFEPYPMRDTVQHFCEKHLDKIKSYMDKVSRCIPPPAKCTIEERRAKKVAKLHFACQGRGEHCLYNRTFFTMKTRNPRIWIHLMFLSLQARSQSALSSRDSSVSSLKNCWDILKCENKTFLTVVTSAFPCSKDQEALTNELRHSGFFDVLEYVGVGGGGNGISDGPLWGCFLCNHPERAVGFLQDSQPVIEGQLKEKKGRWRLFRRWRTRYFTLSPAHLSCKGSKDDKDVTPIEVNQIRSVKVSRGARNIPKAFEIFTGDQSLILKPKDGKNAEAWVQCLSVALAHSHARDSPSNKTHSLPATLRTPI
ncbi:protein melted isoform X2 [Thrips palmi]|uniref:Protein melted isoform X2 n=1 Tax=Thrips palmi TaxID=161013 RepID=A0A6P8ZRK4_THRPL|nr:protein melted isoform X2 [Thrips palmi]